MDRELKRQIKQDDLVTGVEHAQGWVKGHQDQVKLWGLVAVVVLGGLLAFRWFETRRDVESQTALGEALEVLETPVRSAVPAGSPEPQGASFATEQERLSKALAALDGVRQRYGSMRVGKQAALQAAVCRLQLGEFDAARKSLAELVAQHDEPLVAAQARLSLGELEARSGNVDKAVEALRPLVDDERAGLPRDYALMRLAATLEDGHRPQEAAQAYRRLSQDFPESPFATEARRKAEYLGADPRS